MTPTLYLASNSPRRREILERMRLPYTVFAAEADERLGGGIPAEEACEILGRAQGAGGARRSCRRRPFWRRRPFACGRYVGFFGRTPARQTKGRSRSARYAAFRFAAAVIRCAPASACFAVSARFRCRMRRLSGCAIFRWRKRRRMSARENRSTRPALTACRGSARFSSSGSRVTFSPLWDCRPAVSAGCCMRRASHILIG